MTSEVLGWELDEDEIRTHPPRCLLGGRVLRSRRDVREQDPTPSSEEPCGVARLVRMTALPTGIAVVVGEGGNDRPGRELKHARAGHLSEGLSEPPCHRVGRYPSAASLL